MQNLGTLGGIASAAYAVNASGVVAGAARPNVGLFNHAFRWTAGDGMIDLGTFGGGHSEAYAINAGGQIVGEAQNAAARNRAFRWTPGDGMQDLGDLGGDWSIAWGISDAGLVVGAAARPGVAGFHAFRWSPSFGMTDLGALSSGDEGTSAGLAINAGGEVVGYSYTQGVPGSQRAFLWSERAGMRDLSTLTTGWTFGQARAINDAGDILAYGCRTTDGACSWTLLTRVSVSSVPEPATLALAWVGLLGVGVIARGRAKRTVCTGGSPAARPGTRQGRVAPRAYLRDCPFPTLQTNGHRSGGRVRPTPARASRAAPARSHRYPLISCTRGSPHASRERRFS
jgi:probable HAF family extracellular repeat protein